MKRKYKVKKAIRRKMLKQIERLPIPGEVVYQFIEPGPDNDTGKRILMKFIVSDKKTLGNRLISMMVAEDAPGYKKGTVVLRAVGDLLRKIDIEKRHCIFSDYQELDDGSLVTPGQMRLIYHVKWTPHSLIELSREANKLRRQFKANCYIEVRWMEIVEVEGGQTGLLDAKPVEFKPSDILGGK